MKLLQCHTNIAVNLYKRYVREILRATLNNPEYCERVIYFLLNFTIDWQLVN